jgi:PAS domain S-box-containing protein
MANDTTDRATGGEIGWGEETRLDALEVSLRERVRELNEAHRIARLGTWRWVRATDEVTWSVEVYRAYGMDPRLPPPGYETIGAMHTPESRAKLEAGVLRALTTGEPYEFDAELLLPDGSTKWTISRGEVESYEDGKPGILRGTIQDITERKASEQRLVQSEARYRSLLTACSEIVWTTDSKGAAVDENLGWQKFTGQTREQLSGYGWGEAIHPEDRARTMGAWQIALESGELFQVQHRLRRKDGVYRTMEVRGAPARDKAGRILEWVGMHVDVTEKMIAEEVVREREQRFSALAESLPQMVWEANPDGGRTYANQRYTQYTGVSVEEMEGAKWLELVHDEDRDRTEKLWDRSMRSGEPYLNEYRIRRNDGVYRSFLVRAVPMRNDAGEIVRWLGSATDVHDQKLAEEMLRKTEKLAAAGRLAASIAHEINNPLEAVTNALYLALTDSSLSPATRTYLLMAEQELARVAHVATQTLRFHRQSVAASRVDVCGIMDSSVGLYGPRLEACGITVTREYAAGQMLFCRGDELRQVFSNLLSNAFDATRTGGRLLIRIRTSSAGKGDGLRITIADTGDGIPAEIRKKIFEPFLSTKDATGTGLGLWVSEGIVQKHKGRIVARSRTGEKHGTVFCVFLPFDGIEPLGGAGSA